MTRSPIRILLVDDDEDDYIVTRDLLNDISGKEFELDWVDNYVEGLERLKLFEHDIYLLDYRLGANTGLDLLAEAQKLKCKAPMIILTGQGDIEIDQQAQAAGAADYLVKHGLTVQLLDRSIRYSLQQAKILESLRQERANLADRVEERTRELSLANAELARAGQAKDDFLASMSHELRTPLTGILAMSEILMDQIYGPLGEKEVEFARNIHESGRHLLELINDILDVAKVESGKLELISGPVDIARVCNASINLIKQSASKQRLSVSLEIEANLSGLIADEKRLKQMLVNLLGNAVKFTPEEGRIGLKVSCSQDKKVICFQVWDSGIGISEAQIKRLFQPFVQLDSSLSRKFQGTGLGLVLVERMAKLHHGYVTVESQEGRGSQFSICLPYSADERPVAAQEVVPSAGIEKALYVDQVYEEDMSSALLLFVDDDPGNVKLYSEYLQHKGYRVKTACNGREAIEQAKKYNPDLILMDIQMPEVDGLTAMRILREDVKFRKTPIIALTALAMENDKERCLEAGADCYLSKPVLLKKLLRTVDEMLNDDR